MPVNRVLVDGLADLRRELRAASAEAPKALQVANKQVATRVADRARSAYGGEHQAKSGRGAASIRARATQTGASVVFGGPRAPYLPGQEFGARRFAAIGGGSYRKVFETGKGKLVAATGKRKRITQSSMRQFPAYVVAPGGRGGRGYFVYPTVRELYPQIVETYGDVIEAVLKKAFPTG